MNERILVKIQKIREYQTILKGMEKDCKEKYQNDPVYKGALLHYLYLIPA
jgi:hypothetical protein